MYHRKYCLPSKILFAIANIVCHRKYCLPSQILFTIANIDCHRKFCLPSQILFTIANIVCHRKYCLPSQILFIIAKQISFLKIKVIIFNCSIYYLQNQQGFCMLLKYDFSYHKVYIMRKMKIVTIHFISSVT